MKTMNCICLENDSDDSICILIDKKTDVHGGNIGSLVVGVLKDNEVSKPELLT